MKIKTDADNVAQSICCVAKVLLCVNTASTNTIENIWRVIETSTGQVIDRLAS